MEERGARGGVGEERLDELEVAHADRIELQMLGALVVAEPVDVREVAGLRGADVMQRGAGSDGGGGVAGEAEAIERAAPAAGARAGGWRSRR